MKVSNIQKFNLTPQYKQKYQSQSNIPVTQNFNYDNLPTTTQYLAFMGGYSLNLAKTIEQLDKLAEKNPKIYPENIREWLSLVIEGGNKTKETLITIHKKYFASLEDCDTLEQIKRRFPEFKNVKSAFDVDTVKGRETLISKFQEGKSEYFESDEDLSVQLIKLYWGQGFSLNDLKRYADGTDLYYTMKKLEIPTASRDYGHVLKISDPEYNERLTREMTEKRLAALDRKAQEQDGEPVFIPQHRHLSPEHKQRISEGLHRFYEENPERIYQMSPRQKKFYQDNPEKAEKLTKVLNIAWNVFNAESIKKAMSKYFKRFGIDAFNPAANPVHLTKDQSRAMKLFWADNEWAKKSFSKNMKYAWKKVNNEKNYFVELVQIPTSLQRQIRAWAKEKGIDMNEIEFNSKIYKNDPERNEIEQQKYGEPVNAIIRMFEKDFSGNPDDMANTYFRAVARFANTVLKELKPKTVEEYAFKEYLKKVQKLLFIDINGKYYPRSFNTDDIHNIYLDTAKMCFELDFDKYIKTLNKCLDIEYDVVIRKLNPLIEKLGVN